MLASLDCILHIKNSNIIYISFLNFRKEKKKIRYDCQLVCSSFSVRTNLNGKLVLFKLGLVPVGINIVLVYIIKF